MKRFIKCINITLIAILFVTSLVFGAEHHTSWNGDENVSYEIINNDIPYFTEEEKLRTDIWEIYAPLDELGRCGVAYANLCKELLPTEKRKDISKVYPSGWKYKNKSNNKQYKGSNGKKYWIYNRSHLIAHSLAGENDNKLNLITGTDWMNHKGMYEEAEKDVLGYIKKTNNHVLYRVTPIYEKDNLVAEGVRIEAYSVEDNGEGICFNRFYYNIQPGIEINYKTGQNELKINETFIQEGLENTEEPIITTTTENLTETILKEEPDKEQETTSIKEQIKSALTTTKVLFPIIVSTLILVFVVFFTDKILKRKRRK